MKKYKFFICLLFLSYSLFSHEFNIVKEYKFNDIVMYWDKWDPQEGVKSGIMQLASFYDKLFLNTPVNQNIQSFFELENETNNLRIRSLFNRPVLSSPLSDFMIIGDLYENKNLKLYIDSTNLNLPDYDISLENNRVTLSYYITDNKLFALSLKNNLVYWDLGKNGKTIFHNEYEVKDSDKEIFIDYYGIVFSEKTNSYFFGDSSFSGEFPPAYYKYSNDLKIKTKGYENIDFKGMFGFKGVDKNGYAYYIAFLNDPSENVLYNNNVDIKLAFAVLDPWTHEIYIIETPVGDIKLPRNENGSLTLYDYCVDKEGNFYFSDCNINKQQFEIKKLKNDWVMNLGLYNREIGRMNSNHIELRKAADSSADFDGYNFEHDYLWILEHGKEWSKVRKIDGREGWVENKYINFSLDDKNKEKKVLSTFSSKISKNQIMVVSENLRLRETEISTSNIITTMKSGIKVRVLELGKIEQIDDKTEHWVKVEILDEGKDKNNNPIASGTVGWCFGGYLD